MNKRFFRHGPNDPCDPSRARSTFAMHAGSVFVKLDRWDAAECDQTITQFKIDIMDQSTGTLGFGARSRITRESDQRSIIAVLKRSSGDKHRAALVTP
ncbi:predicted protein [Uncinocarpus reesii 1704]|uniref:Uncharacterized protein n=1 Tax=Uncinocarpus reesii (strain UAMH 1704) TaxID=336963 RepID=C4JL07_UNCRE|nr:uncharacterized protein UREG_00222 [Uncinocarpus reesii 1704]EEP75376.1 predicted protein [Uncinocarpus reesii 1704]